MCKQIQNLNKGSIINSQQRACIPEQTVTSCCQYCIHLLQNKPHLVLQPSLQIHTHKYGYQFVFHLQTAQSICIVFDAVFLKAMVAESQWLAVILDNANTAVPEYSLTGCFFVAGWQCLLPPVFELSQALHFLDQLLLKQRDRISAQNVAVFLLLC